MRATTSTASRFMFFAGACLAAACGGDQGQGTLPLTTAGTTSTVVGGTGFQPAAAGIAAAAGTAAAGTLATAGRAAGSGTAGVVAPPAAGTFATPVAGMSSATAGTAAGSGTAGRGPSAGMGAAGMLAAGSGGSAAGGGGRGGAGTGAGGTGQAGTGAPGTATFTAVYKILMTNCASAGACHGSATRPSGGLSLADQMMAYTNLVGVNSTSCTGEKRVVASDPAKSELVHTLDRTQIGTCTRTPKMPEGKAKLAQADIDVVTAWIQAGAPNN